MSDLSPTSFRRVLFEQLSPARCPARSHRIRPLLMLAGLIVLLSTVRAGAAERMWRIQLTGMFPSNENGVLNIYAHERDGKWVAAIASNRKPVGNNHYAFNTSYWYTDLSKAPLKDGAIQVDIQLNVTPDLWVPKSHQGFVVSVHLDTKPGAGDKVTGKYAVTGFSREDETTAQFSKSGDVEASASADELQKLPDPVTFNLNMQGAMIGGKPELKERCIVLRLGFEGAKLASSSFGSMTLKKDTTGITALDVPADAVTYDTDHVQGKVVVPTQTLDLTPVEYTFEFQGVRINNLVAGTYKMTVKQPGQADLVRDGSFDGKTSPGIEKTRPRDDRPWWTPVKDFHPVQPGEHPRLLFRKSDLPALRKRAETPEGKALIARLKAQLGGGEAMPTKWQTATVAYDKNAIKNLPLGAYTYSHAAGFGMLYQLTGEKKYADLALECFEWAFKGIRDRDDRYAWVAPGGALRAGTMLGWYALGYDLACDGWDPATRQRIAKAIAEYNAGKETRDALVTLDMENLVRGTQPPGSNHFGMMVGGASMALMAVKGDPGVADQARIDRLLKIGEVSMARNMTEGFGDGAFFAEGDGTGSMSSQHTFVTALQCWRTAMGHDYVNVERPNARMLALRWIYQTVVRDGKPDFWPIRGAYGHNVWDRDSTSGGGYFSLNMAIVPPEQKSAMKWYYDRSFAAADAQAGAPFDTVSPYPHFTVAAFVNCPFALPDRNPAEVLPLGFRDDIMGFYCWRNHWQDDRDVVITILTRDTRGNYACRAESALKISAGAAKDAKFDWGQSSGDVKSFQTSPHWDTSVMTRADGTSIAIDFTRSSGADVMLVTTGKADGTTVKLPSAALTFKFLGGGPDAQDPKVTVEGDKATVGHQTVSLKDGHLHLGTTTAATP